MDAVYYLPVGTTVLSALFSVAIFKRWHNHARPAHLLWWGAGVAVFGLGTFFEAFNAIFGWDEWVFRGWYIAGALLGGAPLAQGTVYLLLPRRTANRLALALGAFVAVAAVCVLLAPLDASLASDKKLSGNVLGWTWVRGFSPLVNTYAAIFLVGGAVYSMIRYRRLGDRRRTAANALIAVGAILPGIGGSFTRAGYTEVLYITELVGIILIYAGYRSSTAAADGERREIAPAAQVAPLAAP